jgi:hypothetical protein
VVQQGVSPISTQVRRDVPKETALRPRMQPRIKWVLLRHPEWGASTLLSRARPVVVPTWDASGDGRPL